MSVDWRDLIRVEQVCVQVDLSDKDQALQFMAEKLAENPYLKKCKQADIYRDLKAREEQGATGLGDGIAVPHCGMKKADGFGLLIMVPTQSIDYGAFDAKPCDLFFAIVGPQNNRNQHVQILASLASGLLKLDEVAKLRQAKTTEIAYEILSKIFYEELPSQQKVVQTANNEIVSVNEAQQRLTIIVQREKYFMPLLEEAVRASMGSVVVHEARQASHYLYRMPLYSVIFNDKEQSKFLRCIEAIIPNTELGNVYQVIRRIHKKIDTQPGVLVFHQPLERVLGALDY